MNSKTLPLPVERQCFQKDFLVRGNTPNGWHWPQLATYPQSSFSGPVDQLRRGVPFQGILAADRSGRLWISLGAIRFSFAPENNLPSYSSGKRLICRCKAQFG
jgi:hypothetical protein